MNKKKCSHKGHWHCDCKNIPIRPLLTDSNKLAPAGQVLPTFILGHKDHFPTEILWRHIRRRETRWEERKAVAKPSFCKRFDIFLIGNLGVKHQLVT